MQSFINTLMGKAARLFGRSSGLTDTTASISPTALLKNFIPGYGSIHKLLLVTFGIDVTVIVSLGVVLWLADRITHFLWGKIDYLMEKYWTSEIYVSSSDEIFDHLQAFFTSLPQTQALLQLQAKTKATSTWNADSETIEGSSASVEDGEIKYYNFLNKRQRRSPIIYLVPESIAFRFASHEGRMLIMTTSRKDKLDDALIRAGRVDHQVAFHNATQEQAMYATDNAEITEELKSLAEKFSKPIKNGQLSMAVLQGLKYKEDPNKACEEIEKGIEDILDGKGPGRKMDPQQNPVMRQRKIISKGWIKLMSRGKSLLGKSTLDKRHIQPALREFTVTAVKAT